MLHHLNKGASALYSSIPTLTGLWETGIDTKILSSSEILHIGNMLNGMFGDDVSSKIKIEFPRLVVVGTQSSGKSSLLNGILKMDLLPMGSSMVTRCPTQLQLMPINDSNNRAEFGIYDNGQWVAEKTIQLSMPRPKYSEINEFHSEMELQTNRRAGNGKNISMKSILVRVYGKDIPNLSLIDLPGLTMTALTDRGQPKDIKDQIRQMIGNFISQEKTIILAVMPARVDLEADPALELIKEHDPKGERTIGVLTKIDLMDNGTDVTNYLVGEIPNDLYLKYGYFAIKNRSNRDMETMSSIDGIQAEKQFFITHPIYGSRNIGEKLGTDKLSDTLSKILIQNIKRSIPSIMLEINKLDSELDVLIENLGPPLPTEEDAKMSFLHIILAEFCREFTSILDERSASHNIGRTIKDVLIDYRQKIDTIDPFTKEEFSDNYITNCIKNSEGNHMSFPIPSIEVFEHCIREPTKRPINVLIEPSMECLSGVCEQFSCMLDILLAKEHIARFPNLVRRIKNEIFSAVMRNNRDNTSNKIIDIIDMESNYIWTDQKKFNEQLSTIFNQKGILDPSNMRKLLSMYFSTIKDSMKNNIPKIIMLFLVKKTKDSVANILFDNFTKPPLGNLLDEPNGIGEKRKIYQDQKIKVVAIKRALESIQ